MTGVCYVSGTILQGLLVLNYPTYIFERWHGTLLIYAVMAISLFFNTYLARILPRAESFMLVIHVAGLLGVLIPLVCLAPHSKASEVFGDFQNFGGWSSNGLSFFVGLNSAMGCFLGRSFFETCVWILTQAYVHKGVDGADHIGELIFRLAASSMS